MQRMETYDGLIEIKAGKLSKNFSTTERAEAKKTITYLLEDARTIALTESYVLAERDHNFGKLDAGRYRGKFDALVEQVGMYIDATRGLPNRIEALRILERNKEVMGTGVFGLDLKTDCFSGFSNTDELETELASMRNSERAQGKIRERENLMIRVETQMGNRRDAGSSIRNSYSKPIHPSQDSP